MSELDAVRAYREWTASVVLWPSGKHTTHHTDCGCFRALADVAIAALEEALAKKYDTFVPKEEYDHLQAKLAAAEERVERLKGQDCASCSHTKQDTALYPPPPPNHEVYSYCGCPDSPCYMRVITPVDRCAHWSARLTQGSKEADR